MKIEDQMKMHEMYANYWIAMATTGATCRRDIKKGSFNGEQFSDEEKVEDALNTARRHIQLFTECADHKFSRDQEG